MVAAPNFLPWPQDQKFCQKFGMCHGDYSGEAPQELAPAFFLLQPFAFNKFGRGFTLTHHLPSSHVRYPFSKVLAPLHASHPTTAS